MHESDRNARDETLAALLALRGARVPDFRDYAPELLDWAVSRRLAALGEPDEARYRRRLVASPEERAALVDTLLVSVTSFFRNPEVFEALGVLCAWQVIGGAGPLRAWSAGCATGEEAWSLAATLDASVGDRGYEVLGSDVSSAALETARRGEYPSVSVDAVPARFRDLFTSEREGVVAVSPVLRPHVSFEVHDLVGPRLAPATAIVASFDVLLLRNVLIYFDPRLQHAALHRAEGMVAPGGALVLGESCALPDAFRHAFTPFPGLPPSLRIFRRS